MARIKKKGLDYFPVNTDFVHSRLVRRLMKREGDAAFTVLAQIISYIYAGEGYYVNADEDFYEDLTDYLYEKDLTDVKRIVKYAVELGIFHDELFQKYGILSEKEIQRQFLFCTKRRSISVIDERYCLLTLDDLAELQIGGRQGSIEKTETLNRQEKPAKDRVDAEEQKLMFEEEKLLFERERYAPLEQKECTPLEEEKACAETEKSGEFGKESSCFSEENKRNEAHNNGTKTTENGTKSTENAQLSLENADFMHFGTQSTAQHSIAQESTVKQSIDPPLLKGSPREENRGEANRMFAPEERGGEKEDDFLKEAFEGKQETRDQGTRSQVTGNQTVEKRVRGKPAANKPAVEKAAVGKPAAKPPRKVWSQEDISALEPPSDGLPRNLDGLIFNLRTLRVAPSEQYAIICKSNFGVIGHPMWKGFEDIRRSHGKIHLPGRYLLSLCRR